MSDVTRIWRLALPDDWEPDDMWCVSFMIPAGDQYVDALAGAIGLLTLSKTFERDETHQGAATVARTWQRAIEFAPMNISTTCYVIPPIPIPDEAAAADASAAIFTQFYSVIVAELNTCAPTGDDCADCVDDLYASLVPYGASEAVRGALSQLCAALNELTPAERAEYEADCHYTDEFEDLSALINANQYDWLNQLSSWLFDWLNNTSDAILDALNTVGGLLGGNGLMGFVQDNGGIPSGGGAGFGGSCTWVSVADFTIDEQGYYAAIIGGDTLGQYDTGQGWRSSYVVRGGNGQQNLQLFVDFDASTITYLKVTYDLVEGVCTNNDCQFCLSDSLTDFMCNPATTGSAQTIEWSGSSVWGKIGAAGAIAINIGNPANPGGYVLVTSYEIHGVGIKPPQLP